MLVHNGTKLVDLRLRQELALVHDDDIALALLLRAENLQHVRLRGQDLGHALQTDAAADDRFTVPAVCAGLDEPHPQVVLLVVVAGNEGLGGLAGTHGSVFEI